VCACPAIHDNALMFSPVEKKAQLYKLCVRTLLQIIFMIILLMHNCCRHWYSVLSSIQLTGDINFDSWYSLLFVSVFRSIRLHSSDDFLQMILSKWWRGFVWTSKQITDCEIVLNVYWIRIITPAYRLTAVRTSTVMEIYL